ATRAMLHAGEGRFDAARQDLLACHRLGRLIGHGVTHIEFLTAAFIDEMAAQADVAFIEISRPSAKQAIAYLDAINSLPTLPDAAKSMNWGERLGYLQLVSVFMQSAEEMLSEVHELSVFQVAVAKAMLSYVDWDVVLRHGNRSYDVMVGAMQLDTRGQRMAAFADCDRELEQRHSKRPEEILQ